MTKRVYQLVVLLALSALMASATALVSTQGILSDPSSLFEQSFLYNPVTQGDTLKIQTFGFGGTGNQSTGKNAAGNTIVAGGFDPIIGLFSGGAGAGGARINFNDDGICAAGFGITFGGLCRDSTLLITGLAAGTYTISLSVFNNFPPTTETGAYPGGPADFGTNRTNAFAVDVTTQASIPEPMTSMLVGFGLLGLGCFARRKRA